MNQFWLFNFLIKTKSSFKKKNIYLTNRYSLYETNHTITARIKSSWYRETFLYILSTNYFMTFFMLKFTSEIITYYLLFYNHIMWFVKSHIFSNMQITCDFSYTNFNTKTKLEKKNPSKLYRSARQRPTER